MKRYVLISALAALAACNQATAPEGDTKDATAPEAAGTTAWQMSFNDGKKGVTVLTADGKYVHARDNFETGTITTDEATGKSCFTKEGATEPVCVTFKKQEDGSYSGASDDGTVTVTSTEIK